MADYPKSDFPWTFYFNGMAMPKWGANWPALGRHNHANWDWEVGPRDFYIIRCKIDRVGVVESVNPHAFLYAIQELMCLLVTERDGVLETIRKDPNFLAESEEVYDGLMEAAFKMHVLTRRDGHAMWISGYPADQVKLIEAMRRASLTPDDPEYAPPPHVKARTSHLAQLWKDQVKILHAAAVSGSVNKSLRKRLLEL